MVRSDLECHLYRPSLPGDGLPLEETDLSAWFAHRYAGRSFCMMPGTDNLLELRRRAGLNLPPRPQTEPLPSSFRKRRPKTDARPLTNTGQKMVVVGGQKFCVMHYHPKTGYKTKGLQPMQPMPHSQYTHHYQPPLRYSGHMDKPLVPYSPDAQRSRLPRADELGEKTTAGARYCRPRNISWPGGLVDPNMSHNDENRFKTTNRVFHERPISRDLGYEELRIKHSKLYK